MVSREFNKYVSLVKSDRFKPVGSDKIYSEFLKTKYNVRLDLKIVPSIELGNKPSVELRYILNGKEVAWASANVESGILTNKQVFLKEDIRGMTEEMLFKQIMNGNLTEFRNDPSPHITSFPIMGRTGYLRLDNIALRIVPLSAGNVNILPKNKIELFFFDPGLPVKESISNILKFAENPLKREFLAQLLLSRLEDDTRRIFWRYSAISNLTDEVFIGLTTSISCKAHYLIKVKFKRPLHLPNKIIFGRTALGSMRIPSREREYIFPFPALYGSEYFSGLKNYQVGIYSGAVAIGASIFLFPGEFHERLTRRYLSGVRIRDDSHPKKKVALVMLLYLTSILGKYTLSLIERIEGVGDLMYIEDEELYLNVQKIRLAIPQ